MTTLPDIDLGRAGYAEAFDRQTAAHAEVLAWRTNPHDHPPGQILTVEHPAVITVTKRARDLGHIIATPDLLERRGIDLHDTDRGGDVTYHGPGQLVVYPIVDLQRLGLRLHEYMRTLEQAVIDTLAEYGVRGERDPDATGVWVGGSAETPEDFAKICAMGVRVRRWVAMHGLALNVTTDLSHFDLIVPCGLAGRPVTSLERVLTARRARVPSTAEVRATLLAALKAKLLAQARG